MNKTVILIVDENISFIHRVKSLFEQHGYLCHVATDAGNALRLLEDHDISLLFFNVCLPDIDGILFLKRVRQIYPSVIPVAMSAHNGLDSALAAMKHGAFNYVSTPIDEKVILGIAKRLCEHKRQQSSLCESAEKNQDVSGPTAHRHTTEVLSEVASTRPKKPARRRRQRQFQAIIGKSKAIQSVLDIVETVSDTDATVLITGESGTGKELIANALHANSQRNSHLFVPVNCGAIPAELMETQLFGHEKGAFTGAIAARDGCFRVAEGGTLFFDEVGDLPLPMQVKLLRVLQEKCFEPVGSNKSFNADVRIIAATNTDLETMVSEKLFREDLYYRLNVLPIHVPALRERLDDLPLLVETFITMINRDNRRNVEGLTEKAWEFFFRYRWPGNIRELKNVVERMVILKQHGRIDVCDLPQKILNAKSSTKINVIQPADSTTLSQGDTLGDGGVDFYREVEDFENRMILDALLRTNWNKNQAAKLLKLNRTTLVEKVKKRKLEKRFQDDQCARWRIV